MSVGSSSGTDSPASSGSRTPQAIPPVPPPPPTPTPAEKLTEEEEEEEEDSLEQPDEIDLTQHRADYVGPVRSFLARTPLRLRLVAIVSLILLAGLGVSAVLTTTVLQRFLVDQIDEQLETTSDQVTRIFGAQLVPGYTLYTPDNPLPSNYYIKFFSPQDIAGRVVVQSETSHRYGLPNLTAYTLANSPISAEPFFVNSTAENETSGSTRWRAKAFYLTDSAGTLLVYGYVALPVGSVDTTVAQIQRILLVSAVALTAIGAGAGYLAIRRSLRPLGTIERTAAAIADGDLSQRVPQAPVTTEVGSLASSLNSMLSQIEQAFAVQEASEARMRRFVSDASHELRTPLATVRGYGELYRMGALTTPEAMDDTMRRIEDSAKRMGTLVNDLLALARLDEGRPIRMECVDLASLARDTRSDLLALDHTRAVEVVGLDGDGAPASLVVKGDEDQLRQVFTNLAGNIVQHTPAGTPAEIALGTRTVGGSEQVVVEVRDHGPGIPEEQAHRVFERFYRADSSRNRASGGSGLGMAIVAAIVAAHRGAVSVAPTPGGGLTVRLTLPTDAPAAPARSTAGASGTAEVTDEDPQS